MRPLRTPSLRMDADHYYSLTTEQRIEMDVWLTGVLGSPMAEHWVMAVTLGEGCVLVERVKKTESGDAEVIGDTVITYVTEFPCSTLPPVWGRAS